MKTQMLYTELKKWLPVSLLLIFFLSEAFSKYSIIFLNDKSEIQRFIKLGVLVFFGISILKPFKNLWRPALLLIAFSAGQAFLADGFNPEVVVSCSKFLFPIFLFTYFNQYSLSEKSKQLLFLTFEYVLVFNGVLIFLGLLFEAPLFGSYKYGRWGYNGLFINTSTSSYIYAIAIFYFLFKSKKGYLKNWKVLFIIICSILTGTKLVYIAIFGSLLVYFLYFTKLYKKQRYIAILLLILFFALFNYFFFFQFGLFNEIRQEQGLFSSIFSMRDDLLLEKTIPYIQANWQWPNYLFGGVSDLAIRSQMGFVDVFVFWGLIGGVYYLYAYFKTFVTFNLHRITGLLLAILVIIIFLAGNFFENASVAIYLLVLREAFLKDSKKEIGYSAFCP